MHQSFPFPYNLEYIYVVADESKNYHVTGEAFA